ncbi:HAD family hydrolase [Amantichitinum ursilacus]|uniref:5'-nucleotidase n=1 Tax=Amantichitinum ursilacus TaxID=857265 RepID=A0A0N0GNJ3_9NEIS|nr:HAD hydrolase-like protein [Amantichitinum ursilacus]KPC52914.1 5'-nucleotidase [Amantichitinum ursilacus]
MNYDLILFDLDGTLTDPIQGIGRSINHALQQYGYPLQAEAEISRWIGPPLDISFRAITGSQSDAHIAELVMCYRERYGDVGYAENALYPEIPAALQALTDAGVPMGVCTSKRADFAERILKLFQLDQHFGFVSGGEIGVHKWQQIEALKAAGVASNASLMIGDRAVDITAAKRNGLHSAGVLWGHGGRAELEAESPDWLFASPTELSQLLPR